METYNTEVMVFGSNGMLGRYLCSLLGRTPNIKVISVKRSDLDLSNLTSTDLENFFFKKFTHTVTPIKKIVINAAGIINKRPDLGNVDRESIMVNSIFPHLCNTVCRELSIKMIHITTDCVYDGTLEKDKMYSLNNKHNESDIYGLSKSCGEPKKCFIIRTSIIGESPNGRSLIEWLKQNKGNIINGYTNHYWNGVTCLELSSYIVSCILKNNLEKREERIASSCSYSKFEICQIVNEVFDLNLIIEPYETEISVNRCLEPTYPVIKSLNQQIREMKDYRIFL